MWKLSMAKEQDASRIVENTAVEKQAKISDPVSLTHDLGLYPIH